MKKQTFRERLAELRAERDRIWGDPRTKKTRRGNDAFVGGSPRDREAALAALGQTAERGEAKAKGTRRATPLTAKATRIERKGRPPVLEESDGQEAIAKRNRAELKATLAPIQAARWGKE